MLTPVLVRWNSATARHTPFGAGVLGWAVRMSDKSTGGVGVAVRRFGRSGLCEMGLCFPDQSVWAIGLHWRRPRFAPFHKRIQQCSNISLPLLVLLHLYLVRVIV